MMSSQPPPEAEPFWWDDLGTEVTYVAKLRQLREEQGMSQSEMARRAREAGLAFHQPTIQRLEAGERPLRLTEAIHLAQILGSDFQSLIGGQASIPIAQSTLENAMSRESLLSVAEHVDDTSNYITSQVKRIDAALRAYLKLTDENSGEGDRDVTQYAEFVLQTLSGIADHFSVEIVKQVRAAVGQLIEADPFVQQALEHRAEIISRKTGDQHA